MALGVGVALPLARYSGRTLDAYRHNLRGLFQWVAEWAARLGGNLCTVEIDPGSCGRAENGRRRALTAFGFAQTRRDEMSDIAAGSDPPVQTQTLIAVRNVRASSHWYARLLAADALPEHPHRDVYERISHEGRLLLQLHAWDEEGHPNLVNPDAAPPGHGVVLWFQVEDFDAMLGRVGEMDAKIIDGPLVNPAPQHREVWLHDPDGYVVVLASPDGEARESNGD